MSSGSPCVTSPYFPPLSSEARLARHEVVLPLRRMPTIVRWEYNGGEEGSEEAAMTVVFLCLRLLVVVGVCVNSQTKRGVQTGVWNTPDKSGVQTFGHLPGISVQTCVWNTV